MQFPVEQSVATRQVAPRGFLPQELLTHVAGAAQSAGTEQLIGHVASVPSHRYGTQPGEPAAPLARRVQVPGVTSHASQGPPHAESQQLPSAQNPLAQEAARVQAPPLGSLSMHLLVLPSQYAVDAHWAFEVHELLQVALPLQT